MLVDRVSGGVSRTVTNNDALGHMSQFACACLDWWRDTDVTIRRDQAHFS